MCLHAIISAGCFSMRMCGWCFITRQKCKERFVALHRFCVNPKSNNLTASSLKPNLFWLHCMFYQLYMYGIHPLSLLTVVQMADFLELPFCVLSLLGITFSWILVDALVPCQLRPAFLTVRKCAFHSLQSHSIADRP